MEISRGELDLPDVKESLVSGNQDFIPMSSCLLLVVLTTDLARRIFCSAVVSGAKS